MPLPDKVAKAAPTIRRLSSLGGRIYSSDPAVLQEQLRMTRTGGYAKLVTTNAYKAQLSTKRGVLSAVQYLAPDRQSGIADYTACACATQGCSSTCLTGTGHMVTKMAEIARLRRTLRWYLFRERTVQDLTGEVMALEGRAFTENYEPTVRLNGTSDLPFWRWVDSTRHRAVFYDYTKLPPVGSVVHAVQQGRWHLTYSLNEHPASLDCSLEWANLGVNTAIVVSGPSGSVRGVAKKVAQALVDRGEFAGRPTIDGDVDDLRWMDPKVGGWVVLAAKGGDAKTEDHGFVVRFDLDRLLGSDADPVTALLSDFDRERFTPAASAAAAK